MAQRLHRAINVAPIVLLAVACTPRIDFAPLRPGVCVEGQLPCDDEGHAWVVVRPEFAPRTLVFVVDTLALPVASADGTVAGFDLDGIDSGEGSLGGPCGERHRDFASSVDPNLSGVDNQLQLYVPTLESLLPASDCAGPGCLDTALQRSIDEGRQLLVLAVSEVESFEIDDNVHVSLYTATVPAGATLALGPDGRLAPDQRFDGELVSEGSGTLLGGRLAVSGLTVPFNLHAADLNTQLDLQRAQLRFDLGERGLSSGVIGGVRAPVLELRDADRHACGQPVLRGPGGLLRRLLRGRHVHRHARGVDGGAVRSPARARD